MMAPSILEDVLPLRGHAAHLGMVLFEARHNGGCFEGQPAWDDVTFLLQMAASIEGVSVDMRSSPGPFGPAQCESGDDHESEVASAYVLALCRFNMIWSAYEAAVNATSCKMGRSPPTAVGMEGQLLLTLPTAREACGRLAYAQEILDEADRQCEAGGLMTKLAHARRKQAEGTLVQAAALASAFRNFVTHGGDRIFEPGDAADDPRTSRIRISRIHAVGRLVMLLVQALACVCSEEERDELIWLCPSLADVEGSIVRDVFRRLHVSADAHDDLC